MTLPSYGTREIQLPAIGAWPESHHYFDDFQVRALRAAEATGRPLLVRGDPGMGKSQLAHAAAVASQRLFLSAVVDARTEASDLLWRFDAVARLADAHLAAVPGSDAPKQLSPGLYVEPGPLWWAFAWQDADKQLQQYRPHGVRPECHLDNWKPADGTVLLIDEIDKADADLPNSLLEALGNNCFNVPPLGRAVRRDQDTPPPLVIITTNEERELPAPFLRRCLVLTMTLPKDRPALSHHLVKLGKLHFPVLDKTSPEVLISAAERIIDDRLNATINGVYVPGVAEYIDLLRALKEIGGDPMSLMAELSDFFFKKQPAI